MLQRACKVPSLFVSRHNWDNNMHPHHNYACAIYRSPQRILHVLLCYSFDVKFLSAFAFRYSYESILAILSCVYARRNKTILNFSTHLYYSFKKNNKDETSQTPKSLVMVISWFDSWPWQKICSVRERHTFTMLRLEEIHWRHRGANSYFETIFRGN